MKTADDLILNIMNLSSFGNFNGELVSRGIKKHQGLITVFMFMAHPKKLCEDILLMELMNATWLFVRTTLEEKYDQQPERTGLFMAYNPNKLEEVYELMCQWKCDEIQKVKPGCVMIWWD